MAAQVQDVLVIDAVFVDLELLRTEPEIAACSAERGEEFVPEPILVAGQPPQGNLI